jgi:hypothetical protein
LLRYSDYWWDSPGYYVADNNLRTRVWVWGAREGNWTIRTDVSPQRSDHVGWLGGHGNYPGEDGSVAVETFFPCRAESWYLVWLWSYSWVFGDSGFGFESESFARFAGAVPYVVFGSI